MKPVTSQIIGFGAGLFFALLTGCSSGGSGSSGSNATVPTPPVLQALAAPVITTSPALNGAVLVSISPGTAGATVYYSTGGSTPTQKSIAYVSPFLVASTQTVNAIASAAGASPSAPASLAIPGTVPSGTLIWSDEFGNTSGSNAAPNQNVWQFDSMANGFKTVNSELEVYCGWASLLAPCTATPNAYVGATDGYLHIAALQPVAGSYTSARINTAGKFSMTYGRVEARIKLPEGQGLWPAFWLLGNNIGSAGWPACGEMDVMEHVNAPVPDWIAGTLHMSGASGATGPTTHYNVAASGWHVYGMIWSKGMVQYYVDSPANVYATYQASAMPAGAIWPFDSGQASFIILNLAVGGSWPGAPDSSTVFPSEMLVDYVRVYAN
ncbi:beta-glucanase (GH16 family) [Oxalobacteraceae bacterium GrIS 2.11]